MEKLSIVLALITIAGDLATAIDFSTCGKAKSCIFFPKNCKPYENECTLILTYVHSGGDKPYVEFELEAKVEDPKIINYVAAGFNDVNKMNPAKVTACIFVPPIALPAMMLTENGQVNSTHRGSPRIENGQQIEGSVLSKQEGISSDGRIGCKYRQLTTHVSKQVANLDQPNFIVIASGPADKVDPAFQLHFHSGGFFVTTEKIDLTVLSPVTVPPPPSSTTPNAGSSVQLSLSMTHGIILLIALVLFSAMM